MKPSKMLQKSGLFVSLVALLFVPAVPAFGGTNINTSKTDTLSLQVPESLTATVTSSSNCTTPTLGTCAPISISITYNLATSRKVVGYQAAFASMQALSDGGSNNIAVGQVNAKNTTSQTTPTTCTQTFDGTSTGSGGQTIGFPPASGDGCAVQAWTLTTFAGTQTDTLTLNILNPNSLPVANYTGTLTVYIAAE